MSTDLCMLVLSALLTLFLTIPSTIALIRVRGLSFAAGNRHEPTRLPDWGGRAARAHANMIENIAPFAILVLVAHVTGVANSTTAAGAMLFFWGRVAHAICYLAGIPWLRTAAFGVSVIGMAMIAVVILSA